MNPSIDYGRGCNCWISPLQLERVHSQIGKYFERFRNLLGPCNRRYIQTLMILTRAFLQFLHLENCEGDANPRCEGVSGARSANDGSMAMNEFLFSLNIDNINLVKLLRYIKESNIVHKVSIYCVACVIQCSLYVVWVKGHSSFATQVSGYGDKMASLCDGSILKDGDESCDEESSLSAFQALADMLLSLTNNNGDGRIVISRRLKGSGQEGGYLKYLMLTGEKIFSEVCL